MPVAVLMKYCSEGDNIPDAVLLSSHLNTLLKIVSIFIHCFGAEVQEATCERVSHEQGMVKVWKLRDS